MYNAQQTEKEILEFWEKKRIFEKLKTKNSGRKKWSFIDGPITANNPMGVHHAWGRTYKDLYQRFKAMQGFDQRYQNGFDCQGLWVEREEEKDLGLELKEDIEKFGILNFVKACKKRVEKYSKIQIEQSIRLGQWMNWEESYYTMSDNNNLHNWHLLKTYFDNGWLYKGKDAVPWCWRCGTASSKHDIVTEGYRETIHTALFMKFPLMKKPGEYFLIFTTTPWTVPANVGIALNPNIEYVKVENKGEKYWIAKKRIEEIDGKYEILDSKFGKDLKDIKYIMPYKDLDIQNKSPHKVVLWDLASEEEGTGIVHIAPGCGTDDFILGKKEGLPAISPLNESGIFETGYGNYSMKKYSEVNKEVLEDLNQRKFVYKTKNYRHRYPHCWRCGKELVFRLVNEWYVKCSEIRKKLISENNKIVWCPEYGKIRQEEWFKNMSDWLISRKRYWGLPLPIWECSCGEMEVFGSLKELKSKAIDKNKVDNLPEIHRPWIDDIKIKCSKCGKDVSRISDVADAWLDAGIVPFSTLDYLNNNKYWREWWPADFICENMPGQYRGWFNALMWASVALTGKAPFKSILGYETLKDEKGEEMHKSKGNAIWFNEAVEKIGADPMRLLYTLQTPSQEMRFGFNVVKEPKNNLNILYNISKLIKKVGRKKGNNAEDKWIRSRFNTLAKNVTEELEKLHPHIACRELQNFWLVDLSRRYIQLVRDRLAADDLGVNNLLNEIYFGLIKMLAPIVPFVTEKIWLELLEKKIVKGESVHLTEWPKPNRKYIDVKLEEQFKTVFELIELGLAQRDKVQIGLKWPLANAILKIPKEIKLDQSMREIIMRQLNVKSAKFVIGNEFSVELDTVMTKELEAEGYTREFARNIQSIRKKEGLKKGDLINIKIAARKEVVKMLEGHLKFLKNRINAKNVEFSNDLPKKTAEFTIKKDKIIILFL